MADSQPTAPNPSMETPEERLGRAITAHMARCDADDRLDLLEVHLSRMAGAARVLRALSDDYDIPAGDDDARRLVDSIEWVAHSLMRDINSAMDVFDQDLTLEVLRGRLRSGSA